MCFESKNAPRKFWLWKTSQAILQTHCVIDVSLLREVGTLANDLPNRIIDVHYRLHDLQPKTRQDHLQETKRRFVNDPKSRSTEWPSSGMAHFKNSNDDKPNANCHTTLPEPHLSRSGTQHGCYLYPAVCHASPRGDGFHSIRDRIETIPP